jgi:hypothetical protein
VPLDRNAKTRIMHLARVLERKTEPGKHYGVLTGKFVRVLHALLWLIHDVLAKRARVVISGAARAAREREIFPVQPLNHAFEAPREGKTAVLSGEAPHHEIRGMDT